MSVRVVTIWDIDERMALLRSSTRRREAANQARTLIAALRTVPMVRPGATVDRILDNYHAVLARAEEADT